MRLYLYDHIASEAEIQRAAAQGITFVDKPEGADGFAVTRRDSPRPVGGFPQDDGWTTFYVCETDQICRFKVEVSSWTVGTHNEDTKEASYRTITFEDLSKHWYDLQNYYVICHPQDPPGSMHLQEWIRQAEEQGYTVREEL